MRFHSAVTDDDSTDDAASRVIDECRNAAGGKIDLVFVFFTEHHREDSPRMLEKLWLELDPQTVVGCSAEGVIGGDREIEREPGLAVLVAALPDVRVHPFHIGGRSDWRQALSDADDLRGRV